MLLIKNVTIVDKSCSILENQCILIKDKTIVNIAKNIDSKEDYEVIDGKNNFILPGFIDAHTHVGIKEDSMGFEGDDLNEKSNPITPELRGIDGINPMDKAFKEAYEAGVTCVASGPGSINVIGGQFVAIKTYGKRVDNMIVKNPVAMKCAFGENPKKHYNSKGKMPTTRMAIASLLRQTLRKTLEYDRKIKDSKEGKCPAPNFDMSLEAMLPVIHREIPLKAHVHRADDIFTAIRIAKEFNVELTLDHCTDGHLIAEELKNEKFPVIVGPGFGQRGKTELKNKSFHTPGILNKSGLKIAITTDSPVVPIQNLLMCALLSIKSGLNKDEALKAITINPAEILNIDDRVGSIEIGKDADMVIWNAHPFDADAKVLCTIIDGQVVYKDKQFKI